MILQYFREITVHHVMSVMSEEHGTLNRHNHFSVVVISFGARQVWKANDFFPKGMSSKPLKLEGLKHDIVLNRYRVASGVVL